MFLLLQIINIITQSKQMIYTMEHQIAIVIPPALLPQQKIIIDNITNNKNVAIVNQVDLNQVLSPIINKKNWQTGEDPAAFLITFHNKAGKERTWIKWHDKWGRLLRIDPDFSKQITTLNDKLLFHGATLVAVLIILLLVNKVLAKAMYNELKPLRKVFKQYDPQLTNWRRLWLTLPRIPTILMCVLIATCAVFMVTLFQATMLYQVPIVILLWVALMIVIYGVTWGSDRIF